MGSCIDYTPERNVYMTVKERILVVLQQATQPVCDDCLAVAAAFSSRQVAYAVGTTLASEGAIIRQRGQCAMCGKTKIVSSTGNLPPGVPVQPVSPQREISERRWYWEGHVQSSLVRWFREHGYAIEQEANTATHEAGKDIIATAPDGAPLWVSVKGFPDRSTHVQARHWFAGALFDLILYRNERKDVRLALAFPDGFTTYRSLAARTAWLRTSMPFTIYWVSESGEVRTE
jgi:hypothetical protein